MEIEESVRGKDVFIIQSGGGPGMATPAFQPAQLFCVTQDAVPGASHERSALTFFAAQ